MSGLFVTFEGIDGCGKTTQIAILKERLEQEGYKVVLTREPGGTNISERIRDIILDIDNDKMSYVCEMMLYAAARAQLVEEVIKPNLCDETIVLCDRFVDSSYVYQGIARGLGIEIVEEINKIAQNGVYPDVTLILDISLEESQRRRMNEEDDRIERERIKFHEMVRQGYLDIAKRHTDRIKVIDGSKDIDSVSNKVMECIKKLLAK